MGTLEIIYLLLSILFLLICAFFASAEIGFINLQRFRLRHLQEEGVHGADRVARIMEHPSRFLSVVLTGLSFAETIVVALGTILIVALLGAGVGTPVAIVVIAIVLLIFAKVIPKTIAAQHPERIALLYVRPIEILSRLLHPVVIVLSWVAGRFTHIAHSSTIPGELISLEELGTIISMGEEEGVVDEASAQMLRSVVRLGERQVREVMSPRTEAVWLEQGIKLDDFLKIYSESPAQRYPIYEESYDNVVGMLSISDVLTALSQDSIGRQDVVTDLARAVYFVPESKTVGELFGEMRDEGYLMAVVLSEYGGTSGIVTIEQVVEQIVGEVREELTEAKKEFEVVLDQDISLAYERKRWIYLLSLPIMWIFTIWVIFKKRILRVEPKINVFWFDGICLICRAIKEAAASWYALDIMYNYKFGQQKGIRGRVSEYWMGIINVQAVRNRLKLVKRELTKAVKEISREENEVRLLSIASGSAQAVIEVIAELKNIYIEATLLDLDPLAIQYSQKLARKYGIEDKIAFVNESTSNIKEIMNRVYPHIVEMVGFLDYRPHAKAVNLVKIIYRLLLPGGIFLTANTCPNPEKHFLKWVIDWAMIYRKPEELGSILAEGGFVPENCQIICEPHKIHMVAICRKPKRNLR